MGVLVGLEPVSVRRRRIYLLNWSGPEGPHRWRWECPTGCGFQVDEDHDRKVQAQRLADEHACDAGWCALRHVA